jgi:predicted  nucleic acid-binding Zn-ribbon protein
VNLLKEKLRLLIDLQDCDTRLKIIQSKKKEGPVKIQRLQDGLDNCKSQLEAELKLLESFNRERRDAELEVEGLENQIGKSNIKLNNIKSNKEYKAALKELADQERQKTVLEDNLIEIMEKIEALEKKYAASKAKSKELHEKLEKDRDGILMELKALDQVLERLKIERARFSEAIDDNLLRRYDSLRQNKEGLAISPVVNGICQTCHMGIPPQKYNELIRGDALMSCPNCHRIIYWGDDDRFRNISDKA